MKPQLFYVHDPMCSWCWGFEPVKTTLFNSVSKLVTIKYLLAGLAPDSDLPMPDAQQTKIRQIWEKIQQRIPGTEFNYNFWSECHPRRSTYPSNRAVIAARKQGSDYEFLMINKIQQAYYLEAKNPSDNQTLIDIAATIGLNQKQFETDLNTPATQQTLLQEINLARSMGANYFPGLVLEKEGKTWPIQIDYNNADTMLEQIKQILQVDLTQSV